MNPFGNLNFLKRLFELIRPYIFMSNTPITNAEKLYLAAVLKLGQDASPRDRVPDDLGCVESLTEILHSLWPEVPIIGGTYTLFEYLKRSPLFQKTDYPEPGCIIISPTGTGNGKIRGHTGIVGKDGIIMSNDSDSGLFMENFTLHSWQRKYKDFGGFLVGYYRPV